MHRESCPSCHVYRGVGHQPACPETPDPNLPVRLELTLEQVRSLARRFDLPADPTDDLHATVVYAIALANMYGKSATSVTAASVAYQADGLSADSRIGTEVLQQAVIAHRFDAGGIGTACQCPTGARNPHVYGEPGCGYWPESDEPSPKVFIILPPDDGREPYSVTLTLTEAEVEYECGPKGRFAAKGETVLEVMDELEEVPEA